GGSPSGGTYSGSGVSSNMFSAATAGTGSKTITYSVTNSSSCTSEATASITVNAAPTASISSISNKCENDATFSLSGGAPTGGTYKVNGLIATSFNPSTSGIGIKTVRYIVSNANNCSDSASTSFNLDTLPLVTFGAVPNICYNASPLTLTQGAGSPSGGTGVYFGTGVSSSAFNPVSAGAPGGYSLGFAYTSSNGCKDTAYSTIDVDTVPIVTFSALSNICANSPSMFLGNGSPNGGVYKGAGVSSGFFYPDSAAIGMNTLRYIFTDTFGCTDSASQTIQVYPVPNVSLVLPANLCFNVGALNLSTGTPTGGAYYGTNVSSGQLIPVGLGLDTVYYSFTDTNGCTGTQSQVVRIDSVPVVALSPIPSYCASTDTLFLSQGTPAGGVYSGNNVSGNAYVNAGVGIDTISYVFTDANGCKDSTSSTVEVFALPTVSLAALANTCDNLAAVSLTGGLPVGGVYKGNHVVSGKFNALAAGVGTSVIQYVFTNTNNCTDSAQQNILVNAAPNASMSALAPQCDNSADITLSGGLPAGGFYTGPFVVNDKFQASQAGAGSHSVGYVLVNANLCSDTANTSILIEASPVFTLGNDTVICGDRSVTLDPMVTGMSYLWSSGETTQSIVVKTTSIVILTVTDNSTAANCSNTDTVKVSYEENCLGVKDGLLSRASVRYYPNPSKGSFFAQIDGLENEKISLHIINMQGQELMNIELDELPASYNLPIDLEGVTSGAYYINLVTREGVIKQMLMVNQ
ncbi:MAG: T9SS type A sorting domain-containing protein, partial [Flavobacteriales bacterium]|nr:T9SS type A sorting domain-containing protein [Flavobacteriales bacterium]